MEMTLLDKSNYLKGLLIIAKKDNQLSEPEKKIIKSIANKLGFAADFYESSLQSLLANKYLIEDPITFSSEKVAESFILDGLKLAYSDNLVSDVEINWLKATALANNKSVKWFKEKQNLCSEISYPHTNSEFALFSII